MKSLAFERSCQEIYINHDKDFSCLISYLKNPPRDSNSREKSLVVILFALLFHEFQLGQVFGYNLKFHEAIIHLVYSIYLLFIFLLLLLLF